MSDEILTQETLEDLILEVYNQYRNKSYKGQWKKPGLEQLETLERRVAEILIELQFNGAYTDKQGFHNLE